MGMKLEDVDILDALNRIVELNTHHYKDDFDLDKELIPKLAVSGNGEKGGRSVQFHFYVSEQEAAAIQERMEQIGVANLSAYLRKMAVDGYIIHLDMSGVQEMVRLLRICSNNLNQYARRANETGSIYAADVEDVRTRLDSLWDGMDKLLRGFANIP